MIDKMNEEYRKMIIYRWEFLRRNQNYVEDYKACINELKSIEGKQKDFAQELLRRLSNKNPMQLLGLIQKDTTYFLSKYDIFAILDPEIDPQKENEREIEWLLVQCFHHQLAVEMLTDEYFQRTSDVEIAKTRHLVFAIDTDANLENILYEVKNFVVAWKGHRGRVMKKKESRVRFKKYDRYLKIYELHKGGKNYREIAKRVFSDDYKKLTKYSDKHEDVAPLIEKVKNNLSACQDLIDGGYKIISP